MTLVLHWIRITIIIIVGLLIGLFIAVRALPDNRLATWLHGDPSPSPTRLV